mmetsp:Transcript_11975/g.28098  ORF Transcript_11975/g.28098 Transcript_11975/m.28098 type:complete len:91 (+) Transcript_11975:1017-1289(+)
MCSIYARRGKVSSSWASIKLLILHEIDYAWRGAMGSIKGVSVFGLGKETAINRSTCLCWSRCSRLIGSASFDSSVRQLKPYVYLSSTLFL